MILLKMKRGRLRPPGDERSKSATAPKGWGAPALIAPGVPDREVIDYEDFKALDTINLQVVTILRQFESNGVDCVTK
jgi:hypothetical protein